MWIQIIDEKYIVVGQCWILHDYNSIEAERQIENNNIELESIASEIGGDYVIKAKLKDGGYFYYRISKYLFDNKRKWN